MKQIYLHGLGQNPDSWSKVIEQLEAAEHSMCPDLSELVQVRTRRIKIFMLLFRRCVMK